MTQDYKICGNCHNALDFDVNVCPFCGESQSLLSSDRIKQEKKNELGDIGKNIYDRKSIVKFVIIFFIISFLIEFLFIVLFYISKIQ